MLGHWLLAVALRSGAMARAVGVQYDDHDYTHAALSLVVDK
jgi:hypothetical protein